MNKKGQVQQVNAMVFFAILLIAGVFIFSSFDTASSALATTTAGSAAIANTTANSYTSFNLVSIGPLVMAAVAILAVVGLLGGRR
jgi:uncharacterized protein (UPF0333 family)